MASPVQPGLVSRVSQNVVLRTFIYYVALFGAAGMLWRLPRAKLVMAGSLDALFSSGGFMGFGQPPSAAAAGATPIDATTLAFTVAAAMVGAALLALPVAWIYGLTRQKKGYQQSVVQTLMVLPPLVASVVVMVKYSLALAFGLAGIVAAVRFRNTLEDSKDAVYIFLSTAIGLAAAVMLPIAAVISVLFNAIVLLLWYTDFGKSAAYDGDRARRRLEAAQSRMRQTGSFVAMLDNEIFEKMTPEQLELAADRAWRRRRRLREDEPEDDEMQRRDVLLRLRTYDPEQSRVACEAVFDDFLKKVALRRRGARAGRHARRRVCGSTQEDGALRGAPGRAERQAPTDRSGDQMKPLNVYRLPLAALLSAAAAAQAATQVPQAEVKKTYNPPPVFADVHLLEFTIVGPVKQLRRDRATQTPYRAGYIAYASDTGQVTVPVRLRTRGIWRKKNCDIPPLLLNFTKDSTKKTTFARVDRLRLTMHCKDNDEYEQYVLQEYQIYRVQRLLTPLSFDVRLARVTYLDAEKRDTVARRFAFLQEQDDAFAARLAVKLVTTQGAAPDDLDPYESAFFGVFQYFVGNTDFSIRALHNAVLVFREPHHIPVARDFDWSGAVYTQYAKPNPILKIRTVSERLMRGMCAPADQYEKVFALFREKKDAIYALYRDPMASGLKPNVVNTTLKYFDEFYATINDPKRAKRDIVEACLGGSV